MSPVSGEPGGKRQRKKRVKVDALVKDAENAVEGASDESDWEGNGRNLTFATYLKFATCGNTNKINELRRD